MPITKVKVPDGRIVEVNHPEGATQEQIFRFAKQSLPSQEDIRARRLAGVPLDEDEARIMQQQMLKDQDEGFFGGLLRGMGAEFQNVGLNIQRLMGVEGSEQQAQEQAKLQELLKQTEPSAVFGKPAAITATAPLAAASSGALATRLGGGMLANLAGGGVVGGAEGVAFAEPEQDVVEAGLTGAGFGAAGEAGGALLQRGLSRLAAKGSKSAREALGGIPEESLAEAAEEGLGAIPEARKAGIDLTAPQATGERLGEQSFLLSHSATARQAGKFLEKQNKQALEAVDRFINEIAPAETVADYASKARGIANNAIEAAKEARRSFTSPIYKEAFRASKGQNIDITAFTNNLVDEIDKYPKGGDIRKVLEKASKLFVKGNTPLNDLEKIHNARVELGELINTRKDGGLGATAKRTLVQAKAGLDEILEANSPAYAQANAAYASASQPVTELTEGVIGRVANLTDDQLGNIGNRLLDPSNVSASNVQNIKKVFESVPGGDIAWKEVVRGELQRRIGSVRVDLDQPGAANVPQQMLTNLFGNEKKTQTLLRAVDDKTRDNLKLLRRVLQKASKGRSVGSPTASRQEILREAQTGFAKGLNVLSSPKATFDDFVNNLGTTDNLKALANRIFDPVVEDHLQVIQKSLAKQQKIPSETINQLTKYLSTSGAATIQGEQQ